MKHDSPEASVSGRENSVLPTRGHRDPRLVSTTTEIDGAGAVSDRERCLRR